MAMISGLGSNSIGAVPNDGVNVGFIKEKLDDPKATPEQKKEYLSHVLTSMKEDPNPGSTKKTLIDQISKLLDGSIDEPGREALAKTLNTSVENLHF